MEKEEKAEKKKNHPNVFDAYALSAKEGGGKKGGCFKKKKNKKSQGD